MSDDSIKTRKERLRMFDELVLTSKNGIKRVGWPTETWGMITSFSRIHQLFEDIMHRPVWTHELSTTGLKLLRDELENNLDALNPVKSLMAVITTCNDKEVKE